MTNEIRQAFYDVYDGIINPGFEAGNLTNWTKTGTAWDDSPETTAYWPSQQVGFNCEEIRLIRHYVSFKISSIPGDVDNSRISNICRHQFSFRLLAVQLHVL